MNIKDVRYSDVGFLLNGTKFKEQWLWLIKQTEILEEIRGIYNDNSLSDKDVINELSHIFNDNEG